MNTQNTGHSVLHKQESYNHIWNRQIPYPYFVIIRTPNLFEVDMHHLLQTQLGQTVSHELEEK